MLWMWITSHYPWSNKLTICTRTTVSFAIKKAVLLGIILVTIGITQQVVGTTTWNHPRLPTLGLSPPLPIQPIPLSKWSLGYLPQGHHQDSRTWSGTAYLKICLWHILRQTGKSPGQRTICCQRMGQICQRSYAPYFSPWSSCIFLKGGDGPMPPSSFMIAHVFISGSKTNSFCLPILIWKQDGKIVGANALIDSGAMRCFISKDTVQRLGLLVQKLDQTVQAWNVDETPNKSGLVKYKTNIMLDYGGVREHWDLFILNCGKNEVILGLPWLQAINLEINWKDGRIMITPANYRWTTGEPPEVLKQQYLL